MRSQKDRSFWASILVFCLSVATVSAALAQDDCIPLLSTSRRLTTEESIALAVQYQNAAPTSPEKEKLRTALFASVKKIILRQAKIWARRNPEQSVDDLRQEGYFGFLRALQKFDPSMGVPFPAYAKFWIRNFIIQSVVRGKVSRGMVATELGKRYFYNRSQVMKSIKAAGVAVTPESLAHHFNRVEMVKSHHWLTRKLAELKLEPTFENQEKLLKQGSRFGTPQEMARLEAGMQKVHASVHMSLNKKLHSDEFLEVIDSVPSEGISPEEEAANLEVTDKVSPYLDQFRLSLDLRELAIFDRRIVPQLLDESGESQVQLGARFGVSKQAIHQAEVKLLAKFRAFAITSIPQSLVLEILGQEPPEAFELHGAMSPRSLILQ